MKKIKKLNGFVYELERKDLKGNRSGVLLQFEFEDETIGVSDCHPWLEKGDPSLKSLISDLKEYKFSHHLTKRSYQIAVADSEQVLSSLEEKDKIKSHAFVTLYEDFPCDFDILKIKIGEDIENELKAIKKKINKTQKLRLDVYYKVNRKGF